MITGVDPILDGDSGTYMGFLLYGDVDAFDVELFMGDEEVMEAFEDGADFDVTECYVRKVPCRDEDAAVGMMYHYTTSPGRGARKCTRVEQNTFWGHWCHNHIYEPATTGINVTQVLDPIWPMVIARIADPNSPYRRARGPHDGEAMVYLCGKCSTRFSERMTEARREALAAYYAEKDAS